MSLFGNGAAAAGGGMYSGPALKTIQTEALGFRALAGDARVQLTSPWTQPPAPHASLISIASRKGLVAAAGPDSVVVASTEAVRKAFEGEKIGQSQVRSFQPPLSIPLPVRICQLAFTADETYLIMSAEQGGGLAVYEVQSLLQGGSPEPAFQISTNGEALRALVPNPMPEMGELCAVVTDKGNLLMANMKARDFVSGANGHILKAQVSCAAWSTKGKQILAGLGDGTIQQMTPDGVVKAEIPRPSGLDASFYVALLAWLENNLILTVHVSTSQPPQTVYHIITRQGPDFACQKMDDPVDPFGSTELPRHTAARLKGFPPNLDDLLIFSSTANPDVGLISRSKVPLSPDSPPDQITNVFTTTELADDSKRAMLPMNEDRQNPHPIGAVLDLSSKDPVYKPIPTDEMEESAGPIPGYWILTAEGRLSAWWIIYSESIRAGTTYPGLAAAAQPSVPSALAQPVQSNPFGAPAQPAQNTPFGTPSAAPFGSGTAFGATSALGSKPSPWGSSTSNTLGDSSAPKFGQPAFGQSPSFGAKPSPWASGSTASSTPAFGQTGFANAGAGTGGGTLSSTLGGGTFGSGFANFTDNGGFASLAANNANSNGSSIFAAKSSEAADQSMEMDTPSSFPPPDSKPSKHVSFGAPTFELGSTFQRDPREDESGMESPPTKTSMFGGFADALGQTARPASSALQAQPPAAESTTPTTTPDPSKYSTLGLSNPQNKGIFGLPSSITDAGANGTPQTETEPPQVEPQATSNMQDVPDVPLPPDTTSKASFPLGESSSSSAYSPDSSSAPKLPLPTSSPSASPDGSPPAPPDDPLPPDPTKNPAMYKIDFNPPTSQRQATQELKPKTDPATSTLLPPASIKEMKADDVRSAPPAASKSKARAPSIFDTVPKHSGNFVFPSNPPPVSDSEEEEEEEEEEGENIEAGSDGSEGSGVDVAKEISPPSGNKTKNPTYTPQSSFEGGLGGSFSSVKRPESEHKGFFEGPVLPQPHSPSPLRASSSRLGQGQGLSSRDSAKTSRLFNTSQSHKSRLGPPIVGRDEGAEDARLEQKRKAKAKKEAEEAQPLYDPDEEMRKQELSAEIEPTLELHEFLAHPGAPPPAGDNIPAQVEAVYKDINRMIDTLGINARSLTNFIKGHGEAFRHGHRGKDDLQTPDDWTIGELEDLSHILSRDLINELDEARITDVEDKISEIQSLKRDLARERGKRDDLRKLTSSLDEDQVLANRSQPLSAEQAAQQNDLRRDFTRLLKQLSEAEEKLMRLKTSMAGVKGGGPRPTVDQIMRTITKMTGMYEKRSGDVDVLENQMRKLRFATPGRDGGDSREASPFSPRSSRRKLLSSSTMFSPERSMRESTMTPQRGSVMRHSMGASSTSGIGGGMFGFRASTSSPRKKMSGMGDAEKQVIKERRDRRSAVLGKLRGSLERRGPSVVLMSELD